MHATVAPEPATPTKRTRPAKAATTGRKAAKNAKSKAAAPKPSKKAAEATGPRAGTKAAVVVAMLKRKGGATLEELITRLSWQRHSVRGFVSILGSQHGMEIESSRRKDGQRVYRIPAM